MSLPETHAGWTIRQLTDGTEAGRFHSHSYYDIPVFSADGARIAAYRTRFVERMPEPDDAVAVGTVDAQSGGFETIARTRAWSWQQGPMAQFVPGTDRMVWNDREGTRFVSRLSDGAVVESFGVPIYALSPDGKTALSLDMARLEQLRAGYGYAGGVTDTLPRRPKDQGVTRLDLATGEAAMLLSVADAARFVLGRLPFTQAMRLRLNRSAFWFNHAKFSPDGGRFTVKLRWRVPGGYWDDQQGVSLTVAADGSDLRLLARATSHVIWEAADGLFAWRLGGVVRLKDTAPEGTEVGPLAQEAFTDNVHMRKLAPGEDGRGRFVFDTPYREDIDLFVYEEGEGGGPGRATKIASFANHRPVKGPYRCDLHPVPSPDGRSVLVTSLHDGGRQLYLLTPPA